MADEVEEFQLLISAQDNASSTVNQINFALTATLDKTEQLNLANQQASATYSSLADAAAQLGLTQDQLVAMADDTSQLTAANTQLAQSYDQVAQSAASAASAEQDSGGGDDGGGGGLNITGSRRGLTALGSLSGGSPGLSEAARLISVTAAFGPFGLALGAGAIALKAVTDAEAARSKAAQDTADTLNKIAGDVAGGATTESINKQIQQAQSQKDILDATGKALQSVQDKFNDLITNTPALAEQTSKEIQESMARVTNPELYEELSQATGGLVTSFSDLPKVMKDNQKSADDLTPHLAALSAELTQAGVSANDAAAAQKKSADETVSAAQRLVAADQMTADQRKQREQQLMSEIGIYQQQISAASDNSLAQKELGDEQAKLYDEFESLISVSNTYADTLERQKQAEQALTAQNQKELDLLAQEGTVRDNIASLEADIQQIREDSAQKAADLQKDFYAKDDAATAAANEKSLQIEADYAAQREKIVRESGQSLSNDVANRDALQYTLDKQKEQQQLTDAAAADKKAQDQLTQSLNDKYKADYDAYQKSLAQLQESEAKELATKDQALERQEVDLQNILAGETALTNFMYSQLETIHFTYATNIVNGVHAILSGGQAAYLAPSASAGAYPQAPLPAVTGTAAGQQHVVINVNGMGYTLGEIVNGTLGLVDTLLRGNN